MFKYLNESTNLSGKVDLCRRSMLMVLEIGPGGFPCTSNPGNCPQTLQQPPQVPVPPLSNAIELFGFATNRLPHHLLLRLCCSVHVLDRSRLKRMAALFCEQQILPKKTGLFYQDVAPAKSSCHGCELVPILSSVWSKAKKTRLRVL